MMRYLSILQCEAEKVCGENVNYLKYYIYLNKETTTFQQIQRRVMVINSFFAEKLLSHVVASVVGYPFQSSFPLKLQTKILFLIFPTLVRALFGQKVAGARR